MKIVIWVVWLELQIKRGWACLECWYWECLLLRCKSICIVKPCLCKERNSYSLVSIKNAFWCNLTAFTFSVSLLVTKCLWITFCATILACPGKTNKYKNPQWMVWGLSNYHSRAKQNKKKKKFPSGSRVYKTRVPLEKTEQNRATSQTKQSI